MPKILLILLIIVSFPLYAVSDSWKLKNDFTTNKVWQHKSDPNLYVSVEKTKVNDLKSFLNILNDKKTLDHLEDEKKAVLALIGVKNWVAPKKEWFKLSGKTFLNIQGTYTDNSDEKVFFSEYQLVEDGSVLQILFTSVKQESYSSQDKINSFLESVKMDVISE